MESNNHFYIASFDFIPSSLYMELARHRFWWFLFLDPVTRSSSGRSVVESLTVDTQVYPVFVRIPSVSVLIQSTLSSNNSRPILFNYRNVFHAKLTSELVGSKNVKWLFCCVLRYPMGSERPASHEKFHRLLEATLLTNVPGEIAVQNPMGLLGLRM